MYVKCAGSKKKSYISVFFCVLLSVIDRQTTTDLVAFHLFVMFKIFIKKKPTTEMDLIIFVYAFFPCPFALRCFSLGFLVINQFLFVLSFVSPSFSRPVSEFHFHLIFVQCIWRYFIQRRKKKKTHLTAISTCCFDIA